jgi:hypothetical protein
MLEITCDERSRCQDCPWPAGIPCGGAHGVCEGNIAERPPGYPILNPSPRLKPGDF